MSTRAGDLEAAHVGYDYMRLRGSLHTFVHHDMMSLTWLVILQETDPVSPWLMISIESISRAYACQHVQGAPVAACTACQGNW